MTKLSELSPVDPSVTSPFNPVDQAGLPRPIGVEDVIGYLDLSEEKWGLISESSKLETFKMLSEKSHPLALGNVNRAYNEIRFLLKELLHRHMDELKDQITIESIIQELTEVYSHFYPIDRIQAKTIKLKVIDAPDPKLEKLMMDLLNEYIIDLSMDEPFDPEEVYGSSSSPINVDVKHAIIESEVSTKYFIRNVIIAEGAVQPIRLQIPGLPSPTLVTPNRLVVPKIIKFKMGKWV